MTTVERACLEKSRIQVILKKRHAELSAAEQLFESSIPTIPGIDLYDDDKDIDEGMLIDNQRFKKICRLPYLGVYVDEAHHLFGAELQKERTSLRETINAIAEKTKSLVACYNYTGTPYVQNHILPEVVYAYGLAESIQNNYLKEAEPRGYENVKSEDFIREVIGEFWRRYGGKTYDELNPKIAFYASTVEEAAHVLKPLVEQVISELGISTEAVLINVGDEKYTKSEDIHHFNNLDVVGTEGNKKQFIILVEKGKEGWNCRSLFAVALYRKPKSTVFVLQATMRCLRAITITQQKATIFLSKENYDILDDELHKNFNVAISDLGNQGEKDRKHFHVKVLPPPRVIKLKRVSHHHTLVNLTYDKPVSFGLAELDLEKYKSRIYTRRSLSSDGASAVVEANDIQTNQHFTDYTLTAEAATYLNMPCLHVHRVLHESTDGIEIILEKVNQFNDILYDVIIPGIFHAFFKVKTEVFTEDMDVTLLKMPPQNREYYDFSANEELVVTTDTPWAHIHMLKSFHADTYCFDSKPEFECFRQYLVNNKVKTIYFTGMFTSQSQTDLAIPYIDPQSGCLRHYYPDFLAQMSDGTYQLIEVKGDNKIDDAVVLAKQKAAEEVAVASKMTYRMIAGTSVMHSSILEPANEKAAKLL